MRIERIVIAASFSLMLLAAVAKGIGVRKNIAGLNDAAPWLCVAGFSVLLLPLVAVLVVSAITVLTNKNGCKRNHPKR